MSDLKLFHTQAGGMSELESSSAPLEKAIQTQFEKNLDTLLGVRSLPRQRVCDVTWRPDGHARH